MQTNPNPTDKATARPWHVGVSEKDCVRDKFGKIVAKLDMFRTATEQNEANTALIVKAVNEHSALVAVAEAADWVARNPINNHLTRLEDALANLATIRRLADCLEN